MSTQSIVPDKQQLSEWKDADKLQKLYTSDEYKALPTKTKALYEKHLYDTHIVPNFKNAGKQPPTFDQWADFRLSDKFHQNLSKMYDYFEPRTSATERYTDYQYRAHRSFTSLAENLYASAMNYFVPGGINPKTVEHFENLKAEQSKIIDKNSPVEASLTRKFFESIADHSSDFLVWQAVAEATPALGEITKVKGIDRAVVSGVLGRINLAQDLAQTKLGRFAMKRLMSAAQVYTVGSIEGTDSLKKDAIIGAAFPQTGNKEIKALLGEQLNTLGPKATVALLEAAKDISKSPIIDEVTYRLTAANAEIYNKVARSRGYSMYNVMPVSEKKQVAATIYQNLKDVFQHPLANASPELQKYLVESHVAKNLTPEMEAGFKASAEASAKTGQKPSLDNLVQEEVAKAKKEQAAAELADRVVPGAASSKSPEFKSNLPHGPMKLEGDINQYAYALWHYQQKNPNSSVAKMMFNELSARLPELKPEEIAKFPAALRQHMNDLITSGHTSPDDVRGVFRSTNLDAIYGKGKPTEFQDELADEVKEVQKIRKKK